MQKPPYRELPVKPTPSAQSDMAKQKAQAEALKKAPKKKHPSGEYPSVASANDTGWNGT